ncbi:hypothetical protein BDZ97DRAFT_1823175 [Flammula alnicola]|nr:hypothetical protein BDZ97DRAFT_1823175 [Flammula alnicola]
MTRFYNRKAYDRLHRELAMKSCGRTEVASKSDWRYCMKSFLINGNLETRIKLRKTDPHSGVNSTEWAYAPYLTLSRSAWGPLDLVQVPVNREECEKLPPDAGSDKVDVPDEEFVDIKWNIAFSGRTPEKLAIADGAGIALGNYQEFNMTESGDKKEAAQANVEFYQGLAGYRFRDEAHPRRLFFLNAVGAPFFSLLIDLGCLYV